MIALLLPVAFIPMIIATIWIRDTERYERESWILILCIFLWGALIASSIALVVERTLSQYITNFFLLAVVVAPVVEEISKPLILRLVKKQINEIEDGIIFGAVAGLGFAAMENLLYGMQAWDQGLLVLLSLFYIRSIGSGFLHASTTALTGYGYGSKIVHKQSIVSFLPYLCIAIAIHSLFNVVAYSAMKIAPIICVVIAVVFAILLLSWIRKKIRQIDIKDVQFTDHMIFNEA